jgi:hypothetical protein
MNKRALLSARPIRPAKWRRTVNIVERRQSRRVNTSAKEKESVVILDREKSTKKTDLKDRFWGELQYSKMFNRNYFLSFARIFRITINFL